MWQRRCRSRRVWFGLSSGTIDSDKSLPPCAVRSPTRLAYAVGSPVRRYRRAARGGGRGARAAARADTDRLDYIAEYRIQNTFKIKKTLYSCCAVRRRARPRTLSLAVRVRLADHRVHVHVYCTYRSRLSTRY